MPDPDQVMQRLKHTVVNTPGIPHTWQKGTIFSNKTTEIGALLYAKLQLIGRVPREGIFS